MLNDSINALLIIILFFIIGAFSIAYLSSINTNNKAYSNLWKDFRYEVFTVSALLIPLYFGNILFLIFLLLFNLHALIEIFNLDKNNSPGLFKLLGILLSSIIIILVYYSHQLLILPVILFFLYFIISLLVKYKKNELLIITKYLLIITTAISSIIIIRQLEDGILLLIFIYLVSETNDAFAMLFGSKLGKNKVFTPISPNKTLEGLITGIGFALIAGFIFNFYFELFSPLLSVAIIFLIIFGAISGDLLFSSCKRIHNIKDFTPIYKDLNGVLDIYDSFIISALFFYCYFVITQFL